MHTDFIRYGKTLFAQGLNNSHSGNMSRRSGTSIYITRHAAQLGSMAARDIVRVNLHDTRADKPASLEVSVHRAIYLACPDVRAIAHTHPPYATVLSLAHAEIIPCDAEGSYYLPSIPVLKCSKTIASDEVAARLPAVIAAYKAAIVHSHGAFAAGKTLEEAALYSAVLESACRILYLKALLTGK
jgi:L-fuculose-phosphate aldolase